jgi:hypothetical protein
MRMTVNLETDYTDYICMNLSWEPCMCKSRAADDRFEKANLGPIRAQFGISLRSHHGLVAAGK